MPIETEREVTFQLLKDVENLEISIFYSGKTEKTSVYLQKGVSANIVTVNSAQFSQEADLESTATFDLSLEKFSGEANVFKLEAVNLPQQITYEFSDPTTNARLSQIKFSEGVTSLKLSAQALPAQERGRPGRHRQAPRVLRPGPRQRPDAETPRARNGRRDRPQGDRGPEGRVGQARAHPARRAARSRSRPSTSTTRSRRATTSAWT